MMLRDSEYRGAGSYRLVEKLARESLGQDQHGERREFVELVQLAHEHDLPVASVHAKKAAKADDAEADAEGDAAEGGEE